MFDNFFKNMSLKMQGILAFILGMILILGTLGKLQILQGMLNSVMILTGLLLVAWGLNATKGIDKIKEMIQKK